MVGISRDGWDAKTHTQLGFWRVGVGVALKRPQGDPCQSVLGLDTVIGPICHHPSVASDLSVELCVSLGSLASAEDAEITPIKQHTHRDTCSLLPLHRIQEISPRCLIIVVAFFANVIQKSTRGALHYGSCRFGVFTTQGCYFNIHGDKAIWCPTIQPGCINQGSGGANHVLCAMSCDERKPCAQVHKVGVVLV